MFTIVFSANGGCRVLQGHLLVSKGGKREGERRCHSGKAFYDVGVVPESGVGARDRRGEERRGRESHDGSGL